MAAARVSLARHALELIGRSNPGGAPEAARRRLAGLYAEGLREAGIDRSSNPNAQQVLARASCHEAMAAQLDARRVAFVVDLLAGVGVTPVILKGRALACTVWPRAAFRPVGDLDLLVHRADSDRARCALETHGFRACAGDRSPLRPYSVAFSGRGGGGLPTVVDLHRELFLTVGHDLRSAALVDRSRPACLDDRPVRFLRPEDHTTFVFIHAAKHGLCSLKWLLDAIGLARSLDTTAWEAAVESVARARVTTAFFATADVVHRLDPTAVPQFVLEATRPRAAKAYVLRSMISERRAVMEGVPGGWARRSFELVLEDLTRNRARWVFGAAVQRVREHREAPKSAPWKAAEVDTGVYPWTARHHGRTVDLRVSVVIPALDEADNIGSVLRDLPAHLHQVVVVDGDPHDGTGAAARDAVADVIIVEAPVAGKGTALAHGFDHCGGDIIVHLDGDGSTSPGEIVRYVAALVGGADLVKGSRFLDGGGSSDLTAPRRVGNHAFSWLVNRLFGTEYTDVCYGYAAFWRRSLPLLRPDLTGFEAEVVMAIQAARAGLVTTEVPSYEYMRQSGSSKLHVTRDGLRILSVITRAAVTRRRDTRRPRCR